MSINIQSAEWLAVKRHVADRLEALRSQLETPGLDISLTEATRGRIAELRELIEFGEPRPMPEISTENYQ